jgi:hypothetical protein
LTKSAAFAVNVSDQGRGQVCENSAKNNTKFIDSGTFVNPGRPFAQVIASCQFHLDDGIAAPWLSMSPGYVGPSLKKSVVDTVTPGITAELNQHDSEIPVNLLATDIFS